MTPRFVLFLIAFAVFVLFLWEVALPIAAHLKAVL